jgi:putative membrane protein
MQPNNTKAQKLILILKGIAMGIANKIPGVSGGIVALAAGFYEELIYSFSRFDKTALSFFLKKDFKAFYKHINGSFLTLLFGGVIISFFSVSLFLDRFIQI